MTDRSNERDAEQRELEAVRREAPGSDVSAG
jgi:hypothetical protein